MNYEQFGRRFLDEARNWKKYAKESGIPAAGSAALTGLLFGAGGGKPAFSKRVGMEMDFETATNRLRGIRSGELSTLEDLLRQAALMDQSERSELSSLSDLLSGFRQENGAGIIPGKLPPVPPRNAGLFSPQDNGVWFPEAEPEPEPEKTLEPEEISGIWFPEDEDFSTSEAQTNPKLSAAPETAPESAAEPAVFPTATPQETPQPAEQASEVGSVAERPSESVLAGPATEPEKIRSVISQPNGEESGISEGVEQRKQQPSVARHIDPATLETESGRSFEDADPSELIVTPEGSPALGRIDENVATQSCCSHNLSENCSEKLQ
jgi:hypothetical protein